MSEELDIEKGLIGSYVNQLRSFLTADPPLGPSGTTAIGDSSNATSFVTADPSLGPSGSTAIGDLSKVKSFVTADPSGEVKSFAVRRPITNPLGEPDQDWFSLTVPELSVKFGSPQAVLDKLAQKHQTQSWEEELTTERLKEIAEVTSDRVIISTLGLGSTFPVRNVTYIKYSYPTVFYKLEEGLLDTFPLLKSYPHWDRLAERVDETNCWLLKSNVLDWLMRRDAERRIEEELM